MEIAPTQHVSSATSFPQSGKITIQDPTPPSVYTVPATRGTIYNSKGSATVVKSQTLIGAA